LVKIGALEQICDIQGAAFETTDDMFFPLNLAEFYSDLGKSWTPRRVSISLQGYKRIDGIFASCPLRLCDRLNTPIISFVPLPTS
jgi:hypothetical protein